MKWLKHMSNAKYDPRLTRLKNKYGLRGFGLYWAVVEWIAFQLETHKPVPELEQDGRDIAEFFKEDTVLVEEMMQFCIAEHLFEINPDTGRVMCFKLLMYLDNTMNNNPEIRLILDNFKKLQLTSSGLNKIAKDKTRLDKITLDKSNRGNKSPRKQFIPPTLDEVKAYFIANKFNIDPEYFFKFYNEANWIDSRGNPVRSWKQKAITWNKKQPAIDQTTETYEQQAERLRARGLI